jgi:HD-GYP domain-containing protein (c-di-GMP phosphodiesterase class II)
MEANSSIFDALYAYTKGLSTALGYRDLMTRLHSERVRDLSILLAKRCGLSEPHLSALRIGASFHDIGKIGIPDRILLKPSTLDEAEWEEMKKHSEYGEEIMRSTEFPGSQLAATVIRHHHEHFDGGGYPDGLAGDEIPVCSRIISIADSYDAMAVTRSYHQSRTHKEIMQVLAAESNSKFDPQLMAIFTELIETSPLRAN